MLPQNDHNLSVKFGQDVSMGFETHKSFPFIYTFVNSNADPDENATSPLPSLGPLVKANSSRQWNIALDPDLNFKLISMKYIAYYRTDQVYPGPPGRFKFFTNDPAPYAGGFPNIMGNVEEMQYTGTSLTNFISISLSFSGSGAKYLYGGQNTQAIFTGESLIPLPIICMQGYDYGSAQMRTPYLLPREAVIVMGITNTHPTYDLVVSGAIYGMKVRI
jgi:hypothetical protein